MLSPHAVSKRWSNNSTFIQYASWIALALFITLYLLVTFWVILSPAIWSAAQPVAELVITHRQFIRLVNALTVFMCALFFFWPPEGRRLVGRWSDYVGFAFIMIFIEYGLRYLEINMAGSVGASNSRLIQLTFNTIIYLCSGLNNLLFLAAARTLLNKNERFQEPPSLKKSLDIINASTWAEFYRTIPRWAWPLAFMSLFGLLSSDPDFLWARFPDAIFSAYCLGWFGYATAINFNIRRRTVLATLALAASLAYGMGQLVYATNPIIAYTAEPSSNEISSFPLSWIKDIVGSKANEIVVSFKQSPRGIFVTPIEFLDSAVYAVLLLVRSVFFIPSFFLYLLFIISLNDFRHALAETISGRKDYLYSDGIVRAIGESLGANGVSLFVRMPGSPKGRVLSFVWPAEDIHPSEVKRGVSPIEDHPLLSKVMGIEDGGITTASENGEKRARSRASSFDLESPLLVPIKFHGGVIGVLQADLKGYSKSNYTIIQKLRLMADLVSPSVQDLRTLAAIDEIGLRFARLQVDYPEHNFEQATGKMVDILHDVLSPLATGLIIEAGFFSSKHFRPSDGVYLRLLEEQERYDRAIDEEIQTISKDKNVRIEKSQMLVRMSSSTKEIFSLGSLIVAIPAEKDEFSHPTLAAYHRSLKTITSLVADGVLDLARNFLAAIIKDLGVKFNTGVLSREKWFEAIVCACRKAGFLWVVASDRDDKNILGDRETIEIISRRIEEEKAISPAQSLSRIIIINSQESPALRIIGISLPRSAHQLWLGAARRTFGQELDFQSPWMVFLLDLAAVADTTLENIQNRQQAEAAKLHLAESQGIITIAITTGTLMHQLMNMIRDQLFATESLEEALEDKGIELDRTCSHMLKAMKRSAEQMRELTGAFKSITKMDERRPCLIKEAAEQAISLYKVSLMQKGVEVRINVSPEIYADVPFHVVAFALANLIGNAKDAVKYGDEIGIEAQENSTFILCHVKNNGPEIPDSMLSEIFQFGVSQKAGHNGWGLYFVSRALTENGGGIELAYSNPEETCFTIRLPKPASG